MTITLIPSGGGRHQEIGRIDIENEGTGTPERGDYVARLFRRGTTDRVQRMAQIQDYPRQALPVWDLARRVLFALFRGKSLVGAVDIEWAIQRDADTFAPDGDALQMAIDRLGEGPAAHAAATGATRILEIIQAIADETDANVRIEALMALVPRLAAADVMAFMVGKLATDLKRGDRDVLRWTLNGLDAAAVAYNEASER